MQFSIRLGIPEIEKHWNELNQKKVWQSYLENRKPSAGRLYWVYGPAKGEITIIGLEPHPEDKKRGGYQKVRLSEMGEVESRSNPPKTDI